MRWLRCKNPKVSLLRWWYSWKLRKYAKGAAILIDWLGDGAVPCSLKQANERANICATCPKNVPSVTVKSKMADVVRFIAEQKQVKQKLKLRVAREQSLGVCKVCLCELTLKVHLTTEEILDYTSEQELKEFPDNCWIKSESQ